MPFAGYRIANGNGVDDTSCGDGGLLTGIALSGEWMRSEELPTIAIDAGVRSGDSGVPIPGLRPRGELMLFVEGTMPRADPIAVVETEAKGAGRTRSLPRSFALGMLGALGRGGSDTRLVSDGPEFTEVWVERGGADAGAPLSRCR